MKKIFLSLAAIVFVGAAAAGATGAFFSDVETSTGNTFTAGALDLKVDSQSHYDGLVCVDNDGYRWVAESTTTAPARPELIGQRCDGSWTLTDLGLSNKFFNFSDVKPGDQGENTISLHVDNNAWACLDIGTNENNENTLLQPEINAGDAGTTSGELAQNVQLFTWLDNATTSGAVPGDNIWQAGETQLSAVTSLAALSATTTLTLADGGTLAPLPGGSTSYVGLGWCAGALTIGAPGSWSCNGASMNNQSQTDSAVATVQIRAEQARNNPNFRCVLPTVVGANDLESTLVNAAVSGKWYFYDDTNDVLNNTLGTFAVGPSTPPLGTGSALVNPLAGATGRTLFTNSGFGGTQLSAVSALSYSAFTPSGAWSANEAPFLRFNVDFSGSPSYQGSLVYVPSVNGPVTQNAWQTYNLMSPGAMWIYSGANWPAPNAATPGTTALPLSQILTDYPSIRMHPLFPQIGLRVGEPGPAGLTANLDNFSITIGGNTKTYDFGN
jgi:predicted ribosomally synthesized peptide with SipW-like signal peptide